MVTILSGALILLAALMLSVGGLALVYRFVPVSLLQAHYGATGAIYAALYVMFGISLGFSLYLVWLQYEAARLTVEAEAASEGEQHPRRAEVEQDQRRSCEGFWAREVEWTALHLIKGLEPHFSMDATGGFRTKDGRFAVSPEHMDLQALMGKETEEEIEARSPERWASFLAEDDEAAKFLELLLALADGCPVPETYEPPLKHEYTQEEVDAVTGPMKPEPLFVDAEEREATRRLTYVLVHEPHARAHFSALCQRQSPQNRL